MSWLAAYLAVAWVIRIGMVLVILGRDLTPGASMAWLGIIFLHPYIGGSLYLLVGETRLGPRRVQLHRQVVQKYRAIDRRREQRSEIAVASLPPTCQPMVMQAEKTSGMPILWGNSAEFFDNSPAMVDRLVADIQAAKSQVHLLYYIFYPDQTGMRIARAVIDAARRGVACRVLADAVASRVFFHHRGLGAELRAAGVKTAAALPVAPIQRRLPRMDLRNHRKLTVIDGAIGYVGSHNLINPDYGGRRGNPWIDLTGRFTGPIVAELATVFEEDWAFESGEELEVPVLPSPDAADGGIPMQVLPTGPTAPGESYRRVLMGAMQCARRQVILTTPYFVPDEPSLETMMMATDRGVDVKLIVPKHPDHILTAAAGRAHFAQLLDVGVTIHQYRPGLLHTKSVTIDDAFALFGSANLDVRSFNLNFELTTILYGPDPTAKVRDVQLSYLADSDPVDPRQWARRNIAIRYADRAVSLVSPLL
ncbi:MAG TPA: cardiolipin synthase [Tepidisphaeraceae bacterium]|nr:cardiolipin synthase [Tepidisphaeraceae bacterium]